MLGAWRGIVSLPTDVLTVILNFFCGNGAIVVDCEVKASAGLGISKLGG